MTLGPDEAPAAAAAGWWARAGAFAIDVLFGFALLATILLIGSSAPPMGWLWWLCMVAAGVVLLAILLNRVVLPAATGWTLGRAVFGLVVVDRNGNTAGPGRLLVRDLAHLVDTVPLFLGWLWPLLDSRGRTFADLLTGTSVIESDTESDRVVVGAARLASRVLAATAAVAVLITGLGYATVYRPQSQAKKTRDQIAAEGPKIIADMLSYTVKTVNDDFARAQSLATEGYRGELTKQQESARKLGLSDTEYWVTNSAVLSAAENRAAMLMLLQGQRGAAPKQKFIIASVRVNFEKAASGQWQVGDFSIISPPKPPPAPAPAAPSPKPGDAKAPAEGRR